MHVSPPRPRAGATQHIHPDETPCVVASSASATIQYLKTFVDDPGFDDAIHACEEPRQCLSLGRIKFTGRGPSKNIREERRSEKFARLSNDELENPWKKVSKVIRSADVING
jgi:hypothetical protein